MCNNMCRNSEVFRIISFIYKRNTPPRFMNIPRYKQYETTDFHTLVNKKNIIKDKPSKIKN